MSFRRPTGSAFGVSLAAADRASAPDPDAPARLPGVTAAAAAAGAGGRPSPALAARDAFLTLVDAHAAVVVVGDPGAGKTTVLPRFLVEAGWGGGGQAVVVAAPSQAAALAAAHAAAGGEGVGREVGYAVDYEDVCVPVRQGQGERGGRGVTLRGKASARHVGSQWVGEGRGCGEGGRARAATGRRPWKS